MNLRFVLAAVADHRESSPGAADSREVKVDRDDALRAVVDFGMIYVRAAGDCTGTDGDDDLGAGTASYVFFSADFMFRTTVP